MSELPAALPAVLLDAALLAAMLVLPGSAALWLERRAGAPSFSAVFALTVACSAILLGAVGGLLLALRLFSGAAVALVAVVLAAAGVVPLLRWLAPRRRAAALGLGALAVPLLPWLWSALRPGFPPAHTLQWYYWDLGRQLEAAGGGLPGQVLEYGREVRWLPDYVFFNVLSESFDALLRGADATALTAWRVTLAALGIGLVYVVLRLWLPRWSAVAGTGLTAASVFFLAKFNAYKPESYGIVLGLAAVWLLVEGLRRRRLRWGLLAGATAGLAIGVHAIAATVMAMLLVGAGIAEWVALERAVKRRAGLMLVAGATLAVGVVVVSGILLQGRPLVAADALRPELVGGEDPTWIYLRYSTGAFEAEPVPPLSDQLTASVSAPWDKIDVVDAQGWWLPAIAATGLFLQLAFGHGRARRGLGAVALAGLLLSAGMAFFAFAFETYVPRHTGLARFGQYAPLIAAFLLAFALDGYARAWERLSGARLRHGLAVAVIALLAAVQLVPFADTEYREDVALAPDGLVALRFLREAGNPGDVVLTNAATHGQVEYLTGLESPLEGRQPLIEEPDFLLHTNALLLRAHRFFETPADPALVRELGVRWLLIVDDPAVLGAAEGFGGSVAGFRGLPYAERAWRGRGVAIFAVLKP